MMEIKSANFVISNTDVKKCPDPIDTNMRLSGDRTGEIFVD